MKQRVVRPFPPERPQRRQQQPLQGGEQRGRHPGLVQKVIQQQRGGGEWKKITTIVFLRFTKVVFTDQVWRRRLRGEGRGRAATQEHGGHRRAGDVV